MPFELLFALLFAAFVVFSVMMQRAARRREAEEARKAPPEDDGGIPESEWRYGGQPGTSAASVAERLPPVPTAAPRRRADARGALPSMQARRRYSRQSLLGTRRRVQDAFVAATILGPCRADEPYDGG